jgi:hypothetical protein
MGRMYAEGIAETSLTLEQQLDWHLRGNHYPPVPSSMIPVCRDVIIHLNDGGDVNQHFKLPAPATWQGNTSAPAWAIAQGHHLESWLHDEDDYDE